MKNNYNPDELCNVTPALKQSECGTTCCTPLEDTRIEEQTNAVLDTLKVIGWLAILTVVALLLCGKDK